MPRNRQLPELFLRGALANETMAHLTMDQRSHLDGVVDTLVTHNSLAADRSEFLHQLSVTIAGDYRDNREVAEQEFIIAVWRGAVQLLYHSSYEFKCTKCKKSEYLTQRKTTAVINRRFPVCPNCACCAIHKANGSTFVIGDIVAFSVFQAEVQACDERDVEPPTHKSCIKSIKGDPKVKDPEEVLEDPEQVAKWFGEFIWNYFRQIIKENKITKHGKRQTVLGGEADTVAVAAIINILRDHSVKFDYCPQTNPENGYYHIQFPVNCTPPEVTAQYLELLTDLSKHGVVIDHNDHYVRVKHQGTSAKVIEAVVSRSEQVIMANTTGRNSEGDDLMATVTDRYDDNHVDRDDTLEFVRESLPDGVSQQVFDILSQIGEPFNKFHDEYPGNGTPKQMHMARFLGVSPKAVQQAMGEIRVRMLAHDLTTSGV